MDLGWEDAWQDLAGLYRQEGLLPPLIELLKRQAEHADSDQAVRLWSQVGQLAQDELLDQDEAVFAFRQAYQHAPSESNQAALLQALRATDESAPLADFLGICIEQCQDQEQKRSFLLERAGLLFDKLADDDQGLMALRAALELVPEESWALKAQGLYEERGDFQGVADMQEMLIGLSTDDVQAARRVFGLGRIFYERLAANERAAAAFQKAAELAPDWLIPLQHLVTLFEKSDRNEDLYNVHLRLADVQSDPLAKSDALYAAAQLSFHQLARPEQGTDLLRRSAQLLKQPQKRLDELASCLEEEQHWAGAADVLDEIVSAGESGLALLSPAPEPKEFYFRIADLRERAGDKEALIRAYERIGKIDPTDSRVEKLAALYRQQERYADLARLYINVADQESEARASDAWVAAGDAFSHLGATGEVESCLRQALMAQPDNPVATLRLVDLLVQLEDWQRLLEFFEHLDDSLLSHADLRFGVESGLRQLQSRCSRDAYKLAADRFWLRLNPDDLDVLRRLARLLDPVAAPAEHQALLERMDAQAQSLSSEERYALDSQMAKTEILAGRSKEAEVRLLRCLEERPDDERISGLLHELYALSQRPLEHAELLIKEARISRQEDERTAKLLAAAEIFFGQLGDTERAVGLYEQIVAEQPEKKRAWMGLVRCYSQRSEPLKQHQALYRLFSLSERKAQLTLIRQIADLSEAQLDDPVAAMDLERWLSLSPDNERVLDRLLALDRRQLENQKLVEHLAQRIRLCTDSVARSMLLRELAQVYIEKLDQPSAAVWALEQLRRWLPSDLQTLESLDTIYWQTGKWAQAADVLRARIEACQPEERLGLWQDLAELKRFRLLDLEGAIACYREVWAKAPDDPDILVPLQELAIETSGWPLLTEVLEVLVEQQVDPQEERLIRRQLGLLHWSQERLDLALGSFQRVLSMDPGDLVSRRFAARILMEQDAQAALEHVAWLAGRSDVLPLAELVLVRKQWVMASAGLEPQKQIRALQSLLSVQPEPETIRRLIQLHQQVNDSLGLSDALDQLAALSGDAALVEQADEFVEQQQPRLAAMALQRALALPSEHRFDVAVRLADLYQQDLSDDSQALNVLLEAHRMDPNDLSVTNRLVGLSLDLQQIDQAVGLLQHLVAQTTGSQQAEFALRLGHLQKAEPAIAEKAYRQAIEADPDNLEALESLVELLRERNAPDLSNQLARLLQHTDDAKQQAEIRFELGLLAEHSGNMARACEHFESAIALTPGNLSVHRKLILALDSQGQYLPAQSAFDRLLKEVEHPPVSDLVSQIQSNRLRSYMLGRTPRDGQDKLQPGLWVERAELMLAEDDFTQAAQSLERALAAYESQSGANDDAFRVAFKLAHLMLDPLDDKPAAIKNLQIALSYVPDEKEALALLADLHLDEGELTQANRLVEQMLEADPSENALDLALRLGQAFAHTSARQRAKGLFEQILQADSTRVEVYQELEQLLLDADDANDRVQLAELYVNWARLPEASERQVDLFLQASEVLVSAALDGRAVQVLEDASRAYPAEGRLTQALSSLLTQQGRYSDLLAVMERQMEQADEDGQRLALLLEMERLYRERLEEPENAAVCLERCLAIDKNHAQALELLADLRYEQNDFDLSGPLYERLGNRGTASKQALIAFRRGVIAEHRSDLDAAVLHYGQAVSLDATVLKAHQSLVRLLGEKSRWPELARAIETFLQQLAGQSGGEEQALKLKRTLAESYRRQLRFDKAAHLYQQVLDQKPDDLAAISMLVAYHSNKMNWIPATRLLVRQMDLLPKNMVTCAHRQHLGDLYLLQGETELAVQAYGEALDADSECFDVEAGWKLWKLILEKKDTYRLCEWGPRLVDSDLTDAQKVSVCRELGRAWLKEGREQKIAMQYFERVLAHGQMDLEFAWEMANLARLQLRWALYASLMGQVLELRVQQGLDARMAKEGYLEIAKVYQDEVDDTIRAAASIRRAMEFCAGDEDQELLKRLGSLYSKSFDTHQEAVEVFRKILSTDPIDAEAFRFLARLEAARGHQDRCAGYYTGLHFLMPADEESQKYLRSIEQTQRCQQPISAEQWNSVCLEPRADCLLQKLVCSLAPYLELLFPANMERFLLLDTQSQQHKTVEHLAKWATWLCSGRKATVVVAKSDEYQAWTESGQEPILVLSSAVIDRSTPAELAFFVTREIVKISMGSLLLNKFSFTDMRQMLAILSCLADVDTEPLVALPATTPQYLDAIRRVTPKEVLEFLLPLIRQFALEPGAHPLESWKTGVNLSADRVGLLACNDLNGALSVMARMSKAAEGRELTFVPYRSTLLKNDANLMALFRFSYSEQAFRIRRELGLSQ
jgi:tetratricopeptide (TPR) repeat protein